MRLATGYFVYLAAVHLSVLAVAAWRYEALGNWFFAIEGAVVLSWCFGVWLAKRTLEPVRFVQSFSDVLHEQEFSARFSPVGQAEMDELIDLYNRMLSELYEERQRLGEQRGFLEQFVQASPLGVVILDYDGRLTLVNPAAERLLEVEPGSGLGRELKNLSSDLGQELARLDVGERKLLTWRSVHRLRVEKMSFIDRGFTRQFLVIEELTRVIDESERAAYEKLIRLMSHEVNNTVAATNSLLQSCETYAPQIDPSDREDYANALRVVIERNERLNRFMGDFAQVVRLPDPERKPCSLDEVLDSLEVMFRGQCAERKVRWIRHSDPNLPRVRIDREQIEQVLINVVKNALEAIGTTGSIEVALRAAPEGLSLEVIDDGCGLAPGVQGSLFSPFFSTKDQGQGLGLTLSKEILQRHRFDFSLAEQPDGRTSFSIGIPLRRATAD